MKPDLVDADRLRPVIRPEVRVDLESRRLPFAQEQLFGERPRYGGFADRFLAGEAVGDAGMAPTLTTLSLTVPEPTPIL
jgi:hypothetical protein